MYMLGNISMIKKSVFFPSFSLFHFYRIRKQENNEQTSLITLIILLWMTGKIKELQRFRERRATGSRP